MTEEEFLERWYHERPIVEAWGKFVTAKIMERIAPLISPSSADIFIRLPASPRVKQDGSMITKAFYRDKEYQDPLKDITDKVGVRFVVLLGREIPVVCKAIESCAEWISSKDKDYNEDQEKNPYEFKYQSVHYVVYSRNDTEVGALTVPAGTPCEVQVRTLLQHAHSELTHDTIYKPSVEETKEMHRAAAKAMALVEATNDYFEQLFDLIEERVEPNRALSLEMAALYRELILRNPDPTKAEGLLNDAFTPLAGDEPVEAVRSLLHDKPFIIDRIKERAETKLLFRQPSILLAYVGVLNRPNEAQQAWPLTPEEAKPLFTDLGKAAPNS